MSKGKSKTTSNTSYNNQTTLNPWSQQQWQSQFDNIQGMLGDKQTSPYGGQFVAGLSDREQQARSLFEQNMGSFNPDFDEARGLIQGAGYNPQSLGTGLQRDFGGVADDYMNPYQTQVIDALRSQSTDALNENLASAKERSLMNRAYGGSGHAVAEGIAQGEANKALNNQIAGLLYQGYNDARGYYGSDLDRTDNRIMYANDQQMMGNQWDAQRGGMLAELAAGRHQLNANDAYGLNQFGEVERGIEQDRLGMEYNDFLRQEQDQWQKIQAQMGLLGSIPMLTNQSGTRSSQSTQSTNPGLLGTIGQIGGIAGGLFGTGGMFPGVGNAIGGLFSSGMSSAGGGAGGLLSATGSNMTGGLRDLIRSY